MKRRRRDDQARTHEFGQAIRFFIRTAHHTHDEITCCNCGHQWPCIAAMHLIDQLDAWGRENAGKYISEHGPEVGALKRIVEAVVGDRYELYMVNIGFI